MDTKSQPDSTPNQPWSTSVDSILERFQVELKNGLSDAEVTRRVDQYGKNVLREIQTDHWFSILVDQFKNLIIGLLFVAAIVAFGFGEYVEGWAIFAVILINSGIGFVTELKAVRSMEALREMGGITARVRRDGDSEVVSAEDLVPGDIVELDGGDIVAADVRLIDTSKLQVDESPLTGESVPVEKDPADLEGDTPLADRTNMVFKGTHVTRGSALGVVVGTGMETELGEITELVDTAEEERTPLEERLDVLGRKLIWITLLIAAFVTGSGILAGKPIFLMVETGIALSVAAIPEGLPIVATIALARGMWKMAEKNALINKLSAVETLGSTTMILTDKTGTLTENEMTVRQYRIDEEDVTVEPEGDVCFFTQDDPVDYEEHDGLRRALEIGTLCNNASLSDGEKGVGDPMEIALLRVADRVGLTKKALHETYPEIDEDAFDSDSKMMATTHRRDGGQLVAVKGAPESVISECSTIHTAQGEREFEPEGKERWLEQNKRLAGEGLRLLALAYQETDGSVSNPYENLTFLGLVALLDPPRADVRGAIGTCRDAGIKVTMVTGDQAETARNIGYEVGLTDDEDSRVISGQELDKMDFSKDGDREQITGTRIFSRVSPGQKLDLVNLNQEEGHIVGMTGDGVNDAPALKKADIGIAMGKRGTQVAREAADMVLKDDAFSSIVAAVEQGRVIFKNIRKFVFYLLSCNVSEILVVGLASALQMQLPILPLQILFLNLVTDVFPALALGMGEGDPHTMEHPPRNPDEPVIEWNHWVAMGLYGLVFTGAVLGSMAVAHYSLDSAPERAVTISFLTLALAQLWHVFNMRDFGSGFFHNDIVNNSYVWGALGLCVLLLLGAVYVPFVARVLKVTSPGSVGWLVVVGFSLIPLMMGQVIKIFHLQLSD